MPYAQNATGGHVDINNPRDLGDGRKHKLIEVVLQLRRNPDGWTV